LGLFGVGAPVLNDLTKDVTEDEITGLNSEQEDIEMTDDRVVITQPKPAGSVVLISQIGVGG
jgi:hypothetical protein